MTLDYLDFDYSEDTEGVGVFDAMATTSPQQVAAVHAEIVQVLDWAHATFPGRRGPVGDGGDWDYDLQGMQEVTIAETIEFDKDAHRVRVRAGEPATPRHTVTVSISGTPEFCDAFRAQFDPG
ncbi:hypothetical protein [Variovorax sp. GT1P44]|uniref:hypothetical protein n=1 Tax=Variovorax sp. GT1P44 TaxID=3443742 RepID=UPI003F48B4E2